MSLTNTSRAALAGTAVLLAATPTAALAASHPSSGPATAAATSTRTHSVANRQIRLTSSAAYRQVRATAQYQVNGRQRELQIEVRRATALAGRRLVVTVGGRRLGVVRISTRGRAEMTRNTEHRQVVPPVVRGTRVVLSTTQGRALASGRF